MKTILVLVTLAALGAVAGAVIVGSLVFDGTVVDHPYERGISWDEDRKRRASSGITTALVTESFTPGRNDIAISVSRAGGPLDEGGISLRIGRVDTEAHDRAYSLSRQDDGTYGAAVDFPVKGLWTVAVLVKEGERPLEFRHEIRVGK